MPRRDPPRDIAAWLAQNREMRIAFNQRQRDGIRAIIAKERGRDRLHAANRLRLYLGHRELPTDISVALEAALLPPDRTTRSCTSKQTIGKTINIDNSSTTKTNKTHSPTPEELSNSDKLTFLDILCTIIVFSVFFAAILALIWFI